MLKQLAATAAALTIPGAGITMLAERIIRDHLFYTDEWNPTPPDAVGFPYEEAALYTADGLELQGWFFKQPHPAPTLLFCHGTSYNASDMWLTDERTSGFTEFLRGTRCNFFVFDYRGYGRSPGTTTEAGTYLDGEAALAWLYQRDDVDPATIFIYGFSLGSGIATELATREHTAGLILRAPFTSMHDMIIDWDERLRLALLLAPWLPLTRYDNLSKIRRLAHPLLVMHGEEDGTVPIAMGRRIFDSSPASEKTFVPFPGLGHRDLATEFVAPAIATFVTTITTNHTHPTATAPASAR